MTIPSQGGDDGAREPRSVAVGPVMFGATQPLALIAGPCVIEIRESADEGGGWGLRLLDKVSERWGVHEGSTHVWFELRAR